MRIEVEGPEKAGNEGYVELFNSILLDLGITRHVEAAKFIIKPSEPLFLVSVKTRLAAGKIRINDIAEVTKTKAGTFINITDENYAPSLLSLLWRMYGRERIEQLSRLEVLCKGIEEDEILELVIDRGEEMKKKILDALWRLLPEGFKIRYELSSESVITIAATEYEMKKEWKELANELHKEMEELDVQSTAF
ncbi:MAG: methanogenesis marker 17 protein [Methanomassiliicoccales archaeon]